MTPDERLREAVSVTFRDTDSTDVLRFETELAARGLAVVEVSSADKNADCMSSKKEILDRNKDLVRPTRVSKGEPSDAVTSPCSESVSRGDEPTREDGLQTAHPCSDEDVAGYHIEAFHPSVDQANGIAEHVALSFRYCSPTDASSNGRTAPFEGVNAGSTPAASTSITTKKDLQAALIQQGLTIGRYREALEDAIDELAKVEVIDAEETTIHFTGKGRSASLIGRGPIVRGVLRDYRDDTTEAVKRLQGVLDGDYSSIAN